MADIERGNRPLSPHLQVYRLPITAYASILTRISGNALIAGAMLLAFWLVGLAVGGRCWAWANGLATSWFGMLVWLGTIWALWYHLLGGLRHLVFDAGHGLELKQAEASGWGAIIGSVVLTVLTVLYFIVF
ncbi:succinate dehydrogenase, cytochrome b556 subunit [Paracoccus sp. p4-l81]|uniref:succinate dehydrogenase, cytochrome b556 subunit n=1 Tax=unclassified Paracoccus (in: a-proteobacteria) TaxID=2688777 RepID=UPI0035B90519